MDSYEAIRIRRSVRKYRMQPLAQEKLNHLNDFMQKVTPYRKDIRVEYRILNTAEREELLSGWFGVKAPHYLLLFSEQKPEYLINAGYLMEQIVLYLTSHGIGTCYQGLLKADSSLTEDNKLVYVTAIAFGTPTVSMEEMRGSRKRLAEEAVIVYKEEPQEAVRELLCDTLLAPSGMNAQPWRVVAYHNRLHLFCRKGRLFREVLSDMQLLDMGIFMATLKLAAEERWIDVHYVWLDSIADRVEKKLSQNEYVITALLEENMF